MDTATAVEGFSLTMDRTYKASKQLVYEAWTTRDALTEWFAPTKEMSTIVHEMELEVGGKYRIEMLEPDGTSHVTHGEYVALKPFDQIIFTWEWESDEIEVNSLVTIDIKEKDGLTNMVLTHDQLGSQYSVDIHNEGWTGCIAQLDAFMS